MIGYPTKKKVNVIAKSVDTARRGLSLEEDINQSNLIFLDRNLANIHKKPTPITIVKVDYPMRSKAKITEAYFKIPSTTDYNGVYKGRAIDFEAKETANKTSFSLSNLHPHQIKHMENVKTHGAIAFLIIRFTSLNETYYLSIDKLIEFTNNQERKSLPYDWIKTHGHLIPYNYLIPINYLSVIDMYL
jgi:recombination protein U